MKLSKKIAYDYLYNCATDVLRYANTLRSIKRRENTKDEIKHIKRKTKHLLAEIKYIIDNYE